MIIDCISDTHGFYPKLEGGDLLIVAGDLTARDDDDGWCRFETWIMKQQYKEKIIIAGNHDNFLQSMDEHRMWRYWGKVPGVTYLCDSGTKVVYYPPLLKDAPEGSVVERKDFKVWGSPWSKTFENMNPHCKAFTVDTEEALAEKWALIPDDTDILITHSPPYGIRDRVKKNNHFGFECAGSISLQDRAICLDLKLWVIGHIHESYGQELPGGFVGGRDCKIVNASHVNERYEPVNLPVRIIL